MINNAHIILYKRLLYLVAKHSGNMFQELHYYTELQQEIFGLEWSPYREEEEDE